MGKKTAAAPLYTTLRVRLYPTPEQAELFEKTFGCCRYLWNQMLADQQRFYLETGAHFLPTPAKYKAGAPFLREVDNQALIQEHGKLSQAFRVFFKNPQAFGHPRFKRKKEGRDSFTACNHVFESGPTIYTTREGIRMTKAGIVPARFHRRPQNGWKLRRVTVEKTATGKYYAAIVYDCGAQRPPDRRPPAEETTLGLKRSAAHFYVADDGQKADPPPWLQQSQERLAALQRRMSGMKAGSRNYREAVQKYRLLHEHIANQRRDFIHKESRRIANAWEGVCMRGEDLRERPQVSGGAAAGYGLFRKCLQYKLERQGKAFISVDRYIPTTRRCSACGALAAEIDMRRPKWVCSECGAVHEREINAARNIKAEGLKEYQRTKRESA